MLLPKCASVRLKQKALQTKRRLASSQSIRALQSGTESFGAIEKLPQEEKPAPDVLAPSDSVWSPINDEVTAPPSNEEATQSFAVEEEKEESITNHSQLQNQALCQNQSPQ